MLTRGRIRAAIRRDQGLLIICPAHFITKDRLRGGGGAFHMKLSDPATRKVHMQKIGRSRGFAAPSGNPARTGGEGPIPRLGGQGFSHKPYVAIRATKPDPPFV